MPRKKRASLKRSILPDPKFHDVVVAKFISTLMERGKKAVAERIVYQSFEGLKAKKGDDPVKLFKQALENVKPVMEVRSRRVGGATYQVPIEVRSDRRISLGFRWIIGAARDRGEKSMDARLTAELLDALENRGAACKKRDETHKMAEANRAFAHYRW
ncbi:MAG: 30S ribosomal protein S7 [Deltaproteobacteria bacterium]|nr:30S ribosomal protein S7 [Deltaproteobacteria bacterium]